jgi:hypothetical protein
MLMTEVAVGGQVRVQFHPPLPLRSFCERVVKRVDVTTSEGRVFVVKVTHEVNLDREHRIRPGFQDYIRYECRNDFPDRIEMLSTAAQGEQAPDLIWDNQRKNPGMKRTNRLRWNWRATPNPRLIR